MPHLRRSGRPLTAAANAAKLSERIISTSPTRSAAAYERERRLSSIAVLMQYGVTAAALAVLSWRRERGLRPVHALLAVPTLGLGLTLVAFGATWREATTTAITVVVGRVLLGLARRRA